MSLGGMTERAEDLVPGHRGPVEQIAEEVQNVAARVERSGGGDAGYKVEGRKLPCGFQSKMRIREGSGKPWLQFSATCGCGATATFDRREKVDKFLRYHREHVPEWADLTSDSLNWSQGSKPRRGARRRSYLGPEQPQGDRTSELRTSEEPLPAGAELGPDVQAIVAALDRAPSNYKVVINALEKPPSSSHTTGPTSTASSITLRGLPSTSAERGPSRGGSPTRSGARGRSLSRGGSPSVPRRGSSASRGISPSASQRHGSISRRGTPLASRFCPSLSRGGSPIAPGRVASLSGGGSPVAPGHVAWLSRGGSPSTSRGGPLLSRRGSPSPSEGVHPLSGPPSTASPSLLSPRTAEQGSASSLPPDSAHVIAGLGGLVPKNPQTGPREPSHDDSATEKPPSPRKRPRSPPAYAPPCSGAAEPAPASATAQTLSDVSRDPRVDSHEVAGGMRSSPGGQPRPPSAESERPAELQHGGRSEPAGPVLRSSMDQGTAGRHGDDVITTTVGVWNKTLTNIGQAQQSLSPMPSRLPSGARPSQLPTAFLADPAGDVRVPGSGVLLAKRGRDGVAGYEQYKQLPENGAAPHVPMDGAEDELPEAKRARPTGSDVQPQARYSQPQVALDGPGCAAALVTCALESMQVVQEVPNSSSMLQQCHDIRASEKGSTFGSQRKSASLGMHHTSGCVRGYLAVPSSSQIPLWQPPPSPPGGVRGATGAGHVTTVEEEVEGQVRQPLTGVHAAHVQEYVEGQIRQPSSGVHAARQAVSQGSQSTSGFAVKVQTEGCLRPRLEVLHCAQAVGTRSPRWSPLGGAVVEAATQGHSAQTSPKQGAGIAEVLGTTFGRPRIDTSESGSDVLVPVMFENPPGRAWQFGRSREETPETRSGVLVPVAFERPPGRPWQFGRSRIETSETGSGVLVPVTLESPPGRAWQYPSQRALRVLAWATYVRVALSPICPAVSSGIDKRGLLRMCGLVFVLDLHRHVAFVRRQRSHRSFLYRQQPQLFNGRGPVPLPLQGCYDRLRSC